MKYYYSCYFPNKPTVYYTYTASIKLKPKELAVVSSPYGCGFGIVVVHEHLSKKDVTYDISKLTKIICRLKASPDDLKEAKKCYLCAVNGNRYKTVHVKSPIKLNRGDIIFADTTEKVLLNVISEIDFSSGYRLIQKVRLRKNENNMPIEF